MTIMSAIDSKFEQRILKENVIWLTTVRADGMPQPTPVWFIYEEGVFTIYTIPTSQKVKNIAANPKVALNLNSDFEGESYVVVMGEAEFVASPPPASEVPAYIAKYRKGIGDIGMTPESFVQQFSGAIRVTPTRARGE
jgi:PPOX class probable F420-dependent enzyme